MQDNIFFVFLSAHWMVFFAPVAAICAIVYGFVSIKWIKAQPAGNEQMQAIAAAIQEGARAYLLRQYQIILLVGLFLLAVIAYFLHWETAGGFVIGATL